VALYHFTHKNPATTLVTFMLLACFFALMLEAVQFIVETTGFKAENIQTRRNLRETKNRSYSKT
jgi:predicted RND superfamily exporter protein